MTRRLFIAALLAFALMGVSSASAAETYSLDDTATVVVLHPDSLDALADLLIASAQSTVTVSNFPAATVGTVSLGEAEQGALAVLMVGSLITAGSLGFLVARSAAS